MLEDYQNMTAKLIIQFASGQIEGIFKGSKNKKGLL